MEKILSVCSQIFDQSSQPFGIAHVHTDVTGAPLNVTYEYLNPAMAQLTGTTVDELRNRDISELWPNDDSAWLDYFMAAAIEGVACEFEAVSTLISEFLHVSVFPVAEECCGFFVQCVTQWVSQAHTSLLNAQAGIFFYDLRSLLVMMTKPACEITGLQTEYISFVEFMQHLFVRGDEDELRTRMKAFRAGELNSLLFVGELADGRWMRISLGHMGATDRFAFGLIEDITRLHEVEEKSKQRMTLLQQQKKALETALDLAEQGSKAKDTFLANISHDFRTPMNAISGFAGLALECLEDSACVRECLEKILVSCDHLLELVNEILDASRIQSGKLAITCRPMSIGRLSQEVASMFSDQAVKRGLEFVVDTTGVRHDEVVADKMRLSQVLMNVIGNAFKFTPDDGRVTFTIEERMRAAKGFGAFVFTIEDTGCGMSEDFLERIFEPFERSSSPFVAQTEGTGLGMTITKSLVDLMGGTITVKSAVGQGSTFTISIPLELDDEHLPQDMRPSAQSMRRPDLPSMMEACDFSGCRALIADDDELSREVLMRTLERYGFAVEGVRDGDEAVNTLKTAEPGHFDVVMLDMRMPRMNGDEAARIIRSMDRSDTRSIPILAVTADAFDDALLKVKDAGMTGRITKPLDVQSLMGTLKEYLS